MTAWLQKLGVGACIIIVGLVPQMASASTVADFYKGKTVRMVVGYHPGGGYDTYARLIVRFWPAHVPGNPTMIIENMPGAGSRIAANHLAKISPRDGTVVGLIGGDVAADSLLQPSRAKFDGRDLNWIGSPTTSTGICLSWHTAPVKTFSDAKTTQLVVGTASGPHSNTYTFPLILKKVLGAKFHIVPGYAGSSGLMKAIQSGEIQAFCGNVYATISTRHPSWIEKHQINIFIQMALHKNPALAGVPLVMDLVKNTKYYDPFRLLVGAQTALGRPVLAPPKVPQERLAALRNSFDATIRDKGLIAQAKKQHLSIDLVTGKEIQNFLDEMYALPKPVIAEARKLAQPTNVSGGSGK